MAVNWIYEAPTWLALPLFVLAFLAASWAILLLVRPWVRRDATDPKEWDRVLGYSMATYGLFYGVLLALVAVAVYQNYSTVHGVVLDETSALATFYRDVSGLSQPTSGHLQDLLRSYTQHVISVDWPLQRQDIIPSDGTAQISKIQKVLFAYDPKTSGQHAIYLQTIQSFNELVSARRARLNETNLSVPSLLWVLIWVGAAVNALMISLIQVKRVRIHLIMSGLIAIYVGLLIYVTASMDHPYFGTVSIGPDDFRSLLDQLMRPH
ncbi:MAG: hypothetical protein WDM88_09680 [Galbitalea sp.]